MKYSLTHCYTDKNKGDAAIIVSTTQLIRELDSEAEIHMFSTFGPNDRQFKEEQNFISRFATNLFPGLFYQPQPIFKDKDFSRIFHFFWIFIKFSVLLTTHNKFVLKLFFSKYERKGIATFLSSDVIISKGGSYITAQNSTVRQSLSLLHMLYPFILSKRFGKKIVIFSQSLGPVKGRFNRWLLRFALSNVESIYLREELCLKKYIEIEQLSKKVPTKVIPDSAFYLKDEQLLSQHDISIDKSELNVGFTIVDHAFKYIEEEDMKNQKIECYKLALVETIEFLVKEQGAKIHIFPQVIADNSHTGHNDVIISKEIERICHERGMEGSVIYHLGDYNPMQLRSMYSAMDIFVGTRLHSVIFSLSQNVPSINIAYHGTKSQGILNLINGFGEFVIPIDDIDTDKLKNRVQLLLNKRKSLKSMLVEENVRLCTELEKAMNEVIAIIEK
jgi:colanic acid/amylovoran biosynthesis protein